MKKTISFENKSRLNKAILDGKLGTVKRIFFFNNVDEETLNYALVNAATSGELNIVKYLQKKGANLMHKDTLGRSVIFLAASCGHLNVVKYLQSQGMDILEKSNNGETSMMFAAERGYVEMVKYLYSQKMDAHARDSNKDTALLRAARKHQLEVCDVLSLFDASLLAADDKDGRNTAMLITLSTPEPFKDL